MDGVVRRIQGRENMDDGNGRSGLTVGVTAIAKMNAIGVAAVGGINAIGAGSTTTLV